MRTILILFFLFLMNQGFSQKRLFDTLKIDATTKIIGWSPLDDKNQTYAKYNFIIEDSTQIRQFIKNIKLGEETENLIEMQNFELSVVKNFKEIGSWTISPTVERALTHDGHTYRFDPSQITKLNARHPFAYSEDIKTFKSKDEYQTYLAKQKTNPGFLFAYAPLFKYEGSFDIEFKKTSQFSSPKAINDYLKPYIEKIANKNEYRLYYALNNQNGNYTDQYTMTIEGPKKIFDELKIDGLTNKNWHLTDEKAYFFYKK